MTHRLPGGSAATPAASPTWGHHRPGPLFRLLLFLSRAVPQIPVVKQIAFLFRRMARTLEPDHVDVVHQGFRLRLRTRNNISETTFLFMPRRWDVPDRAFFRSHLPEGAVFVDVGCNAGGYVWFLSDVLQAPRILAVEPDPELRERLLFNLQTNEVEGVDVVGVAVGTGEGEGWLRLDRGNKGENVLRKSADEADSAAGVPVRVRPLLEIVEEAGLSRIDGMKVDVEGLEAAVLLDFFERAPDRLRPRLLLVEWRDTPDHDRLGRRLEELGYSRELRTRMNAGFIR